MIGNTPVKIAGLVSEHVHEIMLGIDWLRQYVSNWNFGKDEVTVKGQVHQLTCGRDATKWCRKSLTDRGHCDTSTDSVRRQRQGDIQWPLFL